jgi:hypothetical protein
LLDRIGGIVFTAGDLAYPSGRTVDFQNCYEPTWGRHKSRTRPVPGNHEYETPGAAGYFTYFGESAGPAGLGYYTYTAGPWRILALNSEIDIRNGSIQLDWVRTQLENDTRPCVAAIWHRPLFTSGPNGDNRDMLDLWRVLYQFGVDVVINGHDHLYERFMPQNPDGRADARGIRQFTVGTGGVSLYQAASSKPTTEVLNTTTHGVLKLTLSDTAYHWDFLPAGDVGFTDSGSAGCR